MSADRMPHVLFACDGALAPPAWEGIAWNRQVPMNHSGGSPSLTLRLEYLPRQMLGSLAGRALDLLRIAAYVYGADQMISRGGPADVYAERWRRHMALTIAVSDPDFWNDPATSGHLTRMLWFASDDVWEFAFSQDVNQRTQLEMFEPQQLPGEPDVVVLFSGGTDSLCAAVEMSHQQGRRPILVSHRSNTILQSRQKRLISELQSLTPGWRFAHSSLLVNRTGGDAPETSQRTRAFLFASLGTVIAQGLGVAETLLSDNGVVSINLPVTDGQFGAQTTRSTHPRFIAEFNVLAHMVFGDGAPRLRNSLALRTRPETLDVLRATGTQALLRATVSCAHPRGRLVDQRHCGVCSQCIDRRFGILAAGLAEFDPSTDYVIDIFRDAIPTGSSRSMVRGYYNLALRLQQASEADVASFLNRFPSVWNCLRYVDGTRDQATDSVMRLLIRHGAATVAVMEDQLDQARQLIARRRLPPYSLPGLILGMGGMPVIAPVEHAAFRLDGDICTVTFDGKSVNLKRSDGLVYVHELLRQPRSSVRVNELYRLGSRSADVLSANLGVADSVDAFDNDHSAQSLGRALPGVDAEAMRAYKRELEHLNDEIRDAELAGDQERLRAAKRERAMYVRELGRSSATGGRSRAEADPLSRARQTVQRAIARAIQEVTNKHPELGSYLKNSIKTGQECSYQPDDEICWRL